MNKNVGGTDRVVRVILALVIFALGIIYQSWWGLVGIVPFLTAMVSRCPVYFPFGISTCKINPEEKK